jgi:hypothetical protein
VLRGHAGAGVELFAVYAAIASGRRVVGVRRLSLSDLAVKIA